MWVWHLVPHIEGRPLIEDIWEHVAEENVWTYDKESFKKMKITVFWDFAPRSLVEIDGRLRGACLHYQGN
jgi:hypothetical protein